MGIADRIIRGARGDMWRPENEEGPNAKGGTEKSAKDDAENAAARELFERSQVSKPTRPQSEQERRSIPEATASLVGVKLDMLDPTDLKAFVSLLTETEGTLPKHLRLLADAYRAVPPGKEIPAAVRAMLRQMGKEVPATSRTDSERLKMALTKLSGDERMEVSKTLDPYINRSQKRGRKTG